MKKYVEADLNLKAVDLIELVGLTSQDGDFVMTFLASTMAHVADKTSPIPVLDQLRSALPRLLQTIFNEFEGKRLTMALLGFGALKSELDRAVLEEQIINKLMSVLEADLQKRQEAEKKQDILHV